MKHQEDKRTHRFGNLCSASGLLLSVACCIALIHVELRIQEQHRLISHSVTSCDQLETRILRKVQQDYKEWQNDKGCHADGHRMKTRGRMLMFREYVFSYNSTLLCPVLRKEDKRRHPLLNFCILLEKLVLAL